MLSQGAFAYDLRMKTRPPRSQLLDASAAHFAEMAGNTPARRLTQFFRAFREP